MPVTAVDILKRFEPMETRKRLHQPAWSQIRRVMYPESASFESGGPRGGHDRGDVLDNTGEQAGELLAAALHSMLSNPSTKWLQLRTRDRKLMRDREVALWLDDATDVLHGIFNSPKHGFVTSQTEKYLDLIFYGTGGMFIDERPGFGPLFRSYPLQELWLAENADGRVSSIYRKFKITAIQAVQQFETPSAECRASAADPSKMDDEFEFIHAVFPRDERSSDALDDRNMPFASIYVDVKAKTIVDESGYPENPFVVPRWGKRAREVYGRGPGHKALPDVNTLQSTMEITLVAAEQVIAPALMVDDDGVIGAPDLTYNAINYIRSEAMVGNSTPIRPIMTGGKPEFGEMFMQSNRDRIESAFFSHLIRVSQDPRMTATQVLEIAEQTRQVLGPFLGRMETEDLGPMVDRVFAIEMRRGSFLPVPKALQNAELDVEYTSPMAKAQQLSEARAVSQTLELLGPMSQFDQTVVDNLDFDDMLRGAADMFGARKSNMRDPRQVKKIREARTETAQAESSREEMLQGAGAIGKLAPALAQMQKSAEGG